MNRILLATEKPFTSVTVSLMNDVIEKSGNRFKVITSFNLKEELIKDAAEIDGLIIRDDTIDREVIEAATSLKVIVRAESGYDNTDIALASSKGITVMSTSGQSSNAIAELVIGLAIFGIREFFNGKAGGELRGKTLGLQGYGYAARNVCRIARGLGMTVNVFTRNSVAQAVSEGLELAGSLEELYSNSDIVSIHVPAKGEHIKSVNMEVLRCFKKNAMLINTSRKEIINEADLCQFMEKRTDIKFISDMIPDYEPVFREKFAGRHYFTPKRIGTNTEEAETKSGVAAANQIVAFFEKRTI